MNEREINLPAGRQDKDDIIIDPIKEPETISEKTYNRSLKRDIDFHSKFLTELIQEYIKFKNKNFGENKGYIIHKPDVKGLYSYLNFKWNAYCAKAKFSRKHKYNPSNKCFVEEIKKHNAAHSKLCWINYVMMLLKAKYTIEPNIGRLAEIYREDYLPEDALIDIFCSHQINLEY